MVKLSEASLNISIATFSEIDGSTDILSRKNNLTKHRNDPGRFFGDGVQFKAKLIGILEVGEARGDRMCQEALQDLKMAIRAAGEHKQRITIHVTIEGLRLRDEKSGDSLYHHPVHKISFIAQDMTDSRAFGYIFGSPDSGHRFFGIKTDKAASQVVLAMRDLFQVVFELKKKEIELARQQIQTKSIHEHQLSLSSIKNSSNIPNDPNVVGGLTIMSSLNGNSSSRGSVGNNSSLNTENKRDSKELSPESVADLVDLEQELSSLQRGITQMDRITPNEICGTSQVGIRTGTLDDPFGDSFTNFTTFNLLPPPESGRRSKSVKPCDGTSAITSLSIGATVKISNLNSQNREIDDENWLCNIDQENSTEKTGNVCIIPTNISISSVSMSTTTKNSINQNKEGLSENICELTGSDVTQGISENECDLHSLKSGMNPKPQKVSTATTMMPKPKISSSANLHLKHYSLDTTENGTAIIPHDTDPFSPTRKKSDPDPFQEGDVFSQFNKFDINEDNNISVNQGRINSTKLAELDTDTLDVFNGQLQVNLPPEISNIPSSNQAILNWKADISHLEKPLADSVIRSRPISSTCSVSNSTSLTQVSTMKQQTADVIINISNKKMPHLFSQTRFPKRDQNTINMRRLQESDSLSENEAAPEPPPRPDSSAHVEPPPLPPKKPVNDVLIKPKINSKSVSPPIISCNSTNRYDSLNTLQKYSPTTGCDSGNVPPIPLPSRRVGKSDGLFPGPSRPKKPGLTDDNYLDPINACNSGFNRSIPPLLPPPTQISTRSRTQRQVSNTNKLPVDLYENKEEILQQQQELIKKQHFPNKSPTYIVSDITLSQLLTLSIDDLALRLNVSTNKLSTMTLVELTSYLSDYLSSGKCNPDQNFVEPQEALNAVSVFKVNFDPQTTFIAKFDDTFGEDSRDGTSFVANFEQLNDPEINAASVPNISAGLQTSLPSVPPADRYAVFREIMEQEMQSQKDHINLMGDLTPPTKNDHENLAVVELLSHMDSDVDANAQSELGKDSFLTKEETQEVSSLVLPKYDTKITEVVAQAKDRYAALRDIILVENLFDKSPTVHNKIIVSELTEFSDEFNEEQDLKKIIHDGIDDNQELPAEQSSSVITVVDDDDEGALESSADSNDKALERGERYDGVFLNAHYKKLSTSTQQLDSEKSTIDDLIQDNSIMSIEKQDNKFLKIASNISLSCSKDDLEIDELMQKAISNLSLDSRERSSPASNQNANPEQIKSHQTFNTQSQYDDVSTSPIPLDKSPIDTAVSPHKASISPQQVSSLPAQLSAVSQLIDSVSKQVNNNETGSNSSITKESWATFDIPKQDLEMYGEKYNSRKSLQTRVSSKPLPPPPSNASQNDTAESPCSSDPHDNEWRNNNNRRWTKKERQQTSSSSRDVSPWDDEASEYQKQKPHLSNSTVHSNRHGYYMRHARRMTSCDEDYDYEEDFPIRREQRKSKHSLSKSRDHFDLESPSWYHNQTPYTWSSQDVEQARGRFFERNTYERTTYGPPLYEKRGLGGTLSYDRRTGSASYDKRKYYRDYGRPSYEFDDYNTLPQTQDRNYRAESGSFDKIKLNRRSDYENIYDEGCRYKPRNDYLYDREKKSFDRESVESFEGSSRRRKSFGSGGDMYGSLESRSDFRDRYIAAGGSSEKNRSLRKGAKLRVAGDIEYELDSEYDFQHPHHRGRIIDSRSFQRSNQLISGGIGLPLSQTRVRKSSGSSPWDGDDPPSLNQKTWKRPSSVADSERRLNESRRTGSSIPTLSGSDEEKERRCRKKQRCRGGKELHPSGSGSGTPAGSLTGRYGNMSKSGRNRDEFNYISCGDIDADYADNEPPTDEDKFERINRRRHEVHQRIHENERKQYGVHRVSEVAFLGDISIPSEKYQINIRSDYEFNGEYEHSLTPQAKTSRTLPANEGNLNKFSFDGGFESDFNQCSPTTAPGFNISSYISRPAGSTSINNSTLNETKFRFSNDFSDRERDTLTSNNVLETELLEKDPNISPTTAFTAPPMQQKLRFDDKVKISKFEDDFAKADFNFVKDDQWHTDSAKPLNGNSSTISNTISSLSNAKKQSLRNTKLQQRQELIKKSESINIFAKKSEDPFEDDEFFQASCKVDGTPEQDASSTTGNNTNFNWDDDSNFAKFDTSM